MKKFLAGGVVGALALSLAACSTTPSSESADGAAEGPLVIYSNSVGDGRGEWLVAAAEEAGFEIETVELGGADLAARIIAEVNNPVADVIFGPQDLSFREMKAAGALQAFEPAWAGEVEEVDADGEYYSVVEEPFSLYYNTAAYPNGEGAPEDWTDLFEDPAFHGTYETQTSLGGATTQMILIGILARYRDDAGELGIGDAGWEAVDQFFANGEPAVEGVDLYSRMADGDINTGQMWLAGKASREAEYGIETVAVPSSVGVPFGTQNVGIAAGTDQTEQAEAFLDWFGSAEVQAEWSAEFFTAPTNQAALADADQDAVEATAAFERQDIDWAWVSENLSAWVEEIELNYVG